MRKSLHLIRYECDVCGHREELSEDDRSPLFNAVLPAVHLDERGCPTSKIATVRIDMCKDCVMKFMQRLGNFYDIKSVDCVGDSMKEISENDRQ